jgi:hypothetical protein
MRTWRNDWIPLAPPHLPPPLLSDPLILKQPTKKNSLDSLTTSSFALIIAHHFPFAHITSYLPPKFPFQSFKSCKKGTNLSTKNFRTTLTRVSAFSPPHALHSTHEISHLDLSKDYSYIYNFRSQRMMVGKETIRSCMIVTDVGL